MIYYHYTNLIHAHSIMIDWEIKTSGAEKKLGIKKPSCWFSTNDKFEKGTFATKLDKKGGKRELFTAQEMADTIGCVRFGFPKMKSFITWAKYRHSKQQTEQVWLGMDLLARERGADTTEWFSSFVPISLDYCKSIEVYIEGEWLQINNREADTKAIWDKAIGKAKTLGTTNQKSYIY